MSLALSKIWIFVVVFIFIIGGIFAWLYFSSVEEDILEQATQSEIADWLVYKNQDFQFEIKHPDNWTAIEAYGDSQRSFCFVTETDPKKCLGIFIVSWDVTLEERYSIAKKGFEEKSAITESIAYVDDIEAKVVDVKYPSADVRFVAFERGEYVYTYIIDISEGPILQKIFSTLKFSEPTYIEQVKILLPNGVEGWNIGEENIIMLDKPVRDSYPFTHLILRDSNGESVGIISCKIGGTETTIFKWNTQSVLNYCGAGLEEKIKAIEPGIYNVVIIEDTEEGSIITESELFSISASGEIAPFPFISYITPSRASLGTIVEIKGSGLSGFEGELDVYFERADGKKILLTDTFESYAESQDKLIKIELKEPCQEGETVYAPYSGIPSQCNYIELTSGVYKVYVEAWGKTSNTVSFTVTP